MIESALRTHRFAGFDGADLAFTETGEGRAVILIHGYFSDAATNWVRYGHAAAIAARGFRVIMPDLRAHGLSARPHDPAAYPADALAWDNLALIEQLGLTDYDLGGYSLGARTVMRMIVHGAAPRRIIFSGMGLDGLTAAGRRVDFFRRVLADPDTHPRGTPEFMAAAFLKTTGGDPVALAHVLDTFVDSAPEAVAAIRQPVLVVNGAEDHDNGSARALAGAIPAATYVEVPGNHMSAVLKPELGEAIADFLAA